MGVLDMTLTVSDGEALVLLGFHLWLKKIDLKIIYIR